jgi:hypothetical protein
MPNTEDENIIDVEPNALPGCTPEAPDVDPIYPGAYDENTALDVVVRYKKLMVATIGEDSL